MSRSILDQAIPQWTDYQLQNLFSFQGSFEEKKRLFKMILDQRYDNAIVLTYLHDIAVFWFGYDSDEVEDARFALHGDPQIRRQAYNVPPGPARDSHHTHSIGADPMGFFDLDTNSHTVPPHLGPITSRVNPYILDL